MSFKDYLSKTREHGRERPETPHEVDLWPPGWYSGRIVMVRDDLKPNRAPDGLMVRVDYLVWRNEGDEKKLSQYLCYRHPVARTEYIAQQKLLDLVRLLGTDEGAEWVGRELDVRLKTPSQARGPTGWVNDNEVAGVAPSGAKAGVAEDEDWAAGLMAVAG